MRGIPRLPKRRVTGSGGRGLLSSVGLVIVVSFACSDPLQIKWFELPPPSTSLDPDSVQFGELRFLCDTWWNGSPPSAGGQSIILDAIFDPDAETGPTDRQMRAVAEAGGEIGYKFTFQALRIRIAPSKVPELYKNTEAAFYTVPDLRRYDWLVGVLFSRDLTPEDDSVFSELGGRVTDRRVFIRELAGIMPDRSIPVMRQQPGVFHVGKQMHFCNSA